MTKQFFFIAQFFITAFLFINVELYLVAFFLVLLLALDLKDNQSWVVVLLYSTTLEAFSLFGFKIYDLVVLIALFLFIRKGIGNKVYVQFIAFVALLSFYAIVSIRNGIGITELYPDYLRYFFCFFWLIAGYIAKKEGFSKGAFKVLSYLPWIMIIQGGFYLLSTIIGIDFGIKSFIVASDLSLSRLDEVRVAGLFTDPNKFYITWFYLLAIFLVLFKQSFSRRDLGLLLLLTLVISFVSLSRAAIIVSFLFCILTLVIDFYFRIKQREIYILLPLVVLGAVIATQIDFNQLFFDLTYSLRGERVSEFSGSLDSEKRLLNWILIIDQMDFSNLLVGHGLLNKDYWGQNFIQPPHNTFLGLAYQFGAVFTLYFIGLYSYLIRPYQRLIIPLIFLTIVPMLVVDLFGFRLLWFIFAILYFRKEENDSYIFKKFWP
jgi:hypothetical protein